MKPKPHLVLRKGRWRFRRVWREGGKQRSREIAIHAEPGTPEFDAEYWRLRAGVDDRQKTAPKTSWRVLVAAYKADAAYSLHGLRYLAAVELAEAGCSDAEIQAVTGHKTLAMVQKYRAEASRKRLSKQAQERRE